MVRGNNTSTISKLINQYCGKTEFCITAEKKVGATVHYKFKFRGNLNNTIYP